MHRRPARRAQGHQRARRGAARLRPSPTKDAADLRFGLELGIDLVALSFVQTAEDVLTAREHHERCAGRPVPIIAKIERPAAVENLEAFSNVADGVMVARGDLGLEMPLEQLPRVQKQIMRSARALGRPVILATQVLESMRVDPRPTRAEVSDAANAVDEGSTRSCWRGNRRRRLPGQGGARRSRRSSGRRIAAARRACRRRRSSPPAPATAARCVRRR